MPHRADLQLPAIIATIPKEWGSITHMYVQNPSDGTHGKSGVRISMNLSGYRYPISGDGIDVAAASENLIAQIKQKSTPPETLHTCPTCGLRHFGD